MSFKKTPQIEKFAVKSLGDTVFERLQEMILTRVIKPGERINESKLSTELGISRGPIREACRQLERHGMVEVRTNRGTFVKEINANEIVDLYEIRAVLDQYAGEKAALLIDEHDIETLSSYLNEMTEAVQSSDTWRYFNANIAFHNAIFHISGNRTLPDLYEGLINRCTLFRKTSLSLPGRLPQSLRHHKEIFDALRNKDSERAGQLMKNHVLDAKNVLIRSLD